MSARSIDGSINIGLGGPGCGKTYRMCRVSLASGYYGGPDGNPIPWYGYDANGDVRTHLKTIILGEEVALEEAYRQGAREKITAKERRLKYLKRICMRNLYAGVDDPGRDLNALLDMIEEWVKEGIGRSKSDNPLKGPRAIIFMDEAGAVRQKDEKFWPRMRQARNAGLTIFSTGHRLQDWHPAALACARCYVLWQHNLYPVYELNGIKVPRAQCGIPKSNIVKFVVGADPSVHTWDVEKPGYPPELIVPAWPTIATLDRSSARGF